MTLASLSMNGISEVSSNVTSLSSGLWG